MDQAEKEAKKLLPCDGNCHKLTSSGYHMPGCIANKRPAVAVALRAKDGIIAQWKKDCQRAWMELNALRPEEDDDGACLRCGLHWDDEKDENGVHQCPPGFWNEYEKEIAHLRAELSEKDAK